MKTNAGLVMMSRQFAIEKQIAALSEAISKKDVSGFQASHPHFEEQMRDGVSFTTLSENIRDVTRGDLEHTGQKLDIATTAGYFSVMTPDGVRYTRNGRFRLSTNNFIVNSNGHQLLDESGAPIIITNIESLIIGVDGSVSTEDGVVGRIQIVDFENLQELNDEKMPGFYETEQDGARPENATVHQGYFEGSNVDVVKSMVEFSLLSHRWQDSHHFQKKQDDMELDAPAKLAPVN